MNTDAIPETQPLSLTRGAVYMLEACLQDTTGCTTPIKIVKWAKLWSYIRSLNKRDICIGGDDVYVDFEIPLVILDGETQENFSRRVSFRDLSFAKWQCEEIKIVFNDKKRDVARDAIKHAIENKKISMRGSLATNVNHTLVLLMAFGFGADDE